ncbi:MAG TPA: magnesium transporter [Methanomicrobiales archaeon]|nr:magnesium transporter [Methanomicrobiales archaeon]
MTDGRIVELEVAVIATGLVALILASLAESGAGVFLGSIHDLIALIPGLLLLVPASISMRGSVSGVLVSRLASSMHLGAYEVNFSEESVLGENIRVSLINTVLLSFVLGLLATFVSFLIGDSALSPLDFVLISVISGVVAGSILLSFTFFVSFISYRHRLDLDLIGAPSVTSAGDIITLPIIAGVAIGVLALSSSIRLILGILITLLLIATLWYSYRRIEDIRQAVRESMILLIPLLVLEIIAGTIYNLDVALLTDVAALLILIPPFMGISGSIGGVLSSRLATGMHMGTISPTMLPGRDVLPQVAMTYLYTVLLMPFVAALAQIAADLLGLQSPGVVVLMEIALVAGLVLMTLVVLIAQLIAGLSFSYGLDPDNYGIPIITTVIDLIGAFILVLMMNFFIG